MLTAVADPGFPRGGRQLQSGGANLLLGEMLAVNCMKVKEERNRTDRGTQPPPPYLPMDSANLQDRLMSSNIDASCGTLPRVVFESSAYLC